MCGGQTRGSRRSLAGRQPDPYAPPTRQVIAVGDFNVPATQADFFEGFGRVEEVYDPRELSAIQGACRHDG